MTVQFRGKRFTFTQADGSTLELRGWGDQHHAVFEDLEGYVVVRHPATGDYHYGASRRTAPT